ncbi:MAG: TlpA disulfide reductase family protein [Sulfurospirillaceae bacterium]|nr:TlpA disulfide reductase family protein [Sulfurospirillaceae bacterium]
MRKYLYILLILVPIIFTACSNDKKETKAADQNSSIQKTENGTVNKSITLKDVNGQTIIATKTKNGFTFSNAKDQVVLICFFATWCPPCKAEIPHLVNLQEKYKGKLKIIGILLEKNKDNDEIKNFINYHAINYTITNGEGNYELTDMVGGVKSIPFMIMYDKKGNYSTHYLGAIPEEMIDTDIENTLKK